MGVLRGGEKGVDVAIATTLEGMIQGEGEDRRTLSERTKTNLGENL